MENARAKQAAVVLSVLTALCPYAFGLNPALDIDQYAHKAWTVREGFFKGSIHAIAQMPDGYLWIGTEFGLTRFDGVRSLEWQAPKGEHLPGGRIRSLLAARDGRLWIGTDEGLASWKGGKLTHYAELAGKTVLSILEDHEATIWAAAWGEGTTYGRLCTIRDGRVECYGNDGSLGSGIDGLYEDRGGKLWAGSIDGIWRWKPSPAKFFPMPIFTSSFAEGDGGELFVATLGGIRKLVNEQPGPYVVRAAGQQSKFGKLLRDRDGGLWAGTYDGGLLHVYRGRTRRFTHSDGLSGDNIRCLFQDREGSIWVGTRDGLDRFREYAVPAITEKQGLSNSYVGSILHARDGSTWLATLKGVDRWKNGEIAVYDKRHGLPDPYALCLFEDRAGRIWVTTRRGVVYFERGRFVPVPGLKSGSVVCIAGDDAGDIWMSDQWNLFHLNGKTVEEIPWAKLGHKDFARIILPDPVRGGLWLGFRQGGVAFYKDQSIRLSYGRDQGLGEGQVKGLKLDDDGAIWAATGGGLNLIRSGRTFRLFSANGLPCDIVHWVEEDNDHFFWLYTACGLVRVARSELERWVADPKRTVSITVLDNTDGVRSSITGTDSNPMVAKSADGKIWFLPKDGVSVIDPHHLPFNKVLPPVHIEQIVADDKPYPLRPGMHLPANVRDLRVDYTALSLVAPEKVRFKYMLEGQDQGWREVTNERQAKYTNLAPRSYRFRVIASNNSGVWNETGDTLEFSITPAYYQTNWFRAFAAATVLGLLWAAYRFRIGQLERVRQLEAALAHINRVSMMGELAASIAHEVNQPLSGIVTNGSACLRWLAGDSPNVEEVREAVRDIVRDGKRAGEVIARIRALTKRAAPPREKLDVNETLREVFAIVGDEARRKSVVIRTQFADDLSPVLGDRVQLQQVVLNLVMNGMEAMSSMGERARQLVVSTRNIDPDQVEVTVEDSGTGLDPNTMARIFEPFFTTKSGGMGMGLSISRSILQNHGGRLWATANDGPGTSFHFTLPKYHTGASDAGVAGV